jgi:hypothetical protein
MSEPSSGLIATPVTICNVLVGGAVRLSDPALKTALALESTKILLTDPLTPDALTGMPVKLIV